MTADERINEIRVLLWKNPKRWWPMHKAGVVSYVHAQKIAHGKIANPGIKTLEKIELYLTEEDAA